MNALKSFMTCVIICIIAMLASSCASRNSVAQHQVAAPVSDSSGSASSFSDLKMSESLGKTIVEFPLEAKTQIYAEYDANDNIVVSFNPSAPDFVLPLSETELVRNFEKQKDGDKVKSLTVFLNSKSKFLLSKQSDSLGRLMLVSDTVSVPILPENFISALNFKSKDGSLQVVTYSSLPFEIIPEQGEQFKLSFDRVKFKESLLKKYDVSKLGSAIHSVIAKNDENGNACLMIAGVKKPLLSLQHRGDETSILIRSDGEFFGERQSINSDDKISKIKSEQDEAAVDLQNEEPVFFGMKKSYSGQKITIDMQGASIEQVLRVLSDIGEYDLLLDDSVQKDSRVSLKFTDTPWDQVLDMVLQHKGLGKKQVGRIMRILSAEDFATEARLEEETRTAAIKAKESREILAPLKTEYLQINYNTAADFEGKVKSFLTGRGAVSADTRTNILIVTDTEETLRRVKSFIKKLDRAERQVLIEARLVYATDEFQRSLGIKWGATYDTETTANSASEQYRGGMSTTGMNMLNTVNGITLVGEIGKYLGEDLFSLDASLQLGETKNLVKTISSPRILTLNNNRAEIQQGTKLATATESESGGTTTKYEEAVLKISVLPQITPDNKLILDLDISDDSPKSDGRDIDTKQTKTKMMVNDRETIVIGGVQKSTETSGINQIPGLGDVPGLGLAVQA
jgi:type IV pilus assembly protein PilQ